ncbi:hypothetical protein CALCODRAFT_325559 [Calocera cornea HHB12733]|uniref:Uncharacterized protein n=1 Tax=Calocera cornea HHB12733 TaxID=1353952 RepID=A0A165JFC1_9BASI|nr:hypothetical protein CALCODRAFT_325559 [Calocera cornea HHB12733]
MRVRSTVTGSSLGYGSEDTGRFSFFGRQEMSGVGVVVVRMILGAGRMRRNWPEAGWRASSSTIPCSRMSLERWTRRVPVDNGSAGTARAGEEQGGLSELIQAGFVRRAAKLVKVGDDAAGDEATVFGATVGGKWGACKSSQVRMARGKNCKE